MNYWSMMGDLLGGLAVSVEIFVFTLLIALPLAFTIAVTEMFTIAKQLSSANTTMAPLIAAGGFYYVFNYLVAFAMERLEKRYAYYD